MLLSEEWDNNIYISENYLQLLQKLDRKNPQFYIRRPKDILTYAMYFNVKPCMEINILKKRVEVAIQKESLKKNMSDVISDKLGMDYFQVDKFKEMERKEKSSSFYDLMGFYLESLLLYFDADDKLKDNTFRQVTKIIKEGYSEVVSYPLLINMLVKKRKINIYSYTMKKFKRMDAFLTKIDKIEV